ncbi:MAG TPA: head-tail connector protein, partial [Nitrosomonas sp.]|nr:head-tail connector protein [Nitrosomonas sp.]
MQLTPTTTEIVEPVTLDEAKEHLRVFHNEEDGFIQSLLLAAYRAAENICHCVIPLQTFDYQIDCFAPVIVLPRNPVVSVESVAYTDENGDPQTLDPSDYYVETGHFKSTIKPAYNASWPATESGYNKVTVSFTAGFADPPEDIKAAIKLIIGELFYRREQSIVGVSVAPVPVSAQ